MAGDYTTQLLNLTDKQFEKYDVLIDDVAELENKVQMLDVSINRFDVGLNHEKLELEKIEKTIKENTTNLHDIDKTLSNLSGRVWVIIGFFMAIIASATAILLNVFSKFGDFSSKIGWIEGSISKIIK